jgi:hypothetical protein
MGVGSGRAQKCRALLLHASVFLRNKAKHHPNELTSGVRHEPDQFNGSTKMRLAATKTLLGLFRGDNFPHCVCYSSLASQPPAILHTTPCATHHFVFSDLVCCSTNVTSLAICRRSSRSRILVCIDRSRKRVVFGFWSSGIRIRCG